MVHNSKFLYKLMASLILSGLVCLFTGYLTWASVPANVRVGIITNNSGSQYRNASVVTFTVKGDYRIIDLGAIPGDEVIGIPAEGESWQVYYLADGVQVYKDGQPVKISVGSVVVREVAHSAANRVSLNSFMTNNNNTGINRPYRGNMEFRSSGNSLVAINELPMDEYLYGVVPREMSNSWPVEALKAQAVAARTYTVANYNKHAVEGFNMLDTPSDQAYGGANSEGANATAAVNQTSGRIVSYQGEPISALYHSTSGGHTEDNENVWGTTPYDYLRGIDDIYSTKDGLADWTYTTTVDEIRNRLVQSGSQIGPIGGIQLEKYHSGRVKTVIISDVNGNTIRKSGSEFGKLFNPKFYTYISGTSFMSNFFEVKMDQIANPTYYVLNGMGQKAAVPGAGMFGVSDDESIAVLNGTNTDFYVLSANGTSSASKAATGSVVFNGHGWGHGVGMSQWGAYEMAKEGKTYIEILQFYYTGVYVE